MRAFLIKYFTRASWGSNPRRLALSLHRFSQVEADSGWQALNLLYRTDDVDLQAELFKIAVEEAEHAELFRNLAQKIDPQARAFLAQRERMDLYAAYGSVLKTLADISVSEMAVHDEFDKYGKATDNADVKALFEKIKEDEADHGNDTFDTLRRVAGDEKSFRSALRSASHQRMWRNYGFVSKGFGNFMMSILTSLFYWSLGFLVLLFSGGRGVARQDVTGQ